MDNDTFVNGIQKVTASEPATAPIDTGFRDAISMVLGASLPLGLHNLYICIYQAIVRKSWLNTIQVVASFFQLINQVCFIILFTQPADSFFHNQCTWFINMADAFFFTYQILSVTVLMIRTTGLYNKSIQRYILRSIFSVMLVVGVGFILYATLRRVDVVLENRCAGLYFRVFNLIGKVILFCLYLLLLIAFCIPVFKLMAKTKFETTAKLLLQIVMGVSFRIILAIVGFLITVILSFAGVWGDYFFIEFTVQNFCGITSSTFEANAAGDGSGSGGRSGNKAAANVLKEEAIRATFGSSKSNHLSSIELSEGSSNNRLPYKPLSPPSIYESESNNTAPRSVQRRPSNFAMGPTPSLSAISSRDADMEMGRIQSSGGVRISERNHEQRSPFY
ncbi:hypothetical protein HDU97_007562 [Phlyctochytrium planicorne]|nr:hypothetical protein HDU97_007562 [Phlyctochytrium planicorne]